MTPEKLCVSREIAERMAKLSWPQGTSLFVWGRYYMPSFKEEWRLEARENTISICISYYRCGYVDAPTVGEILENLPISIEAYRHIDRYVVGHYYWVYDEKSLANAAGLYWLWWKEKEK